MRALLPALLLACAALAGCASSTDDGSDHGTVGFAVTDAPVDDFHKIEVTISRVAIHRSASGDDASGDASATTSGSGTNSTTASATGTSSASGSATAAATASGTDDAGPSAGWITIVDTPRTVDLLALHRNNTAETLGFADVPAGHYQQVRFSIDEVVGTYHNGTEVTMTVPSGVARTSGQFTVEAGGNTTITVEIDLERSVDCQSNGNRAGTCTFRTHIGQVRSSENQ